MQARQPDFVFPAADSLATQQARGGAMAWQAQYNEIKSQEAANLSDALNHADNNSGQALTYGMYLSRNKTISDIAQDMTKQNYNIDQGASQTYLRQGEINEWQAQNKLDTLFFLQALFLYLCLVIVLVFLRQWMLIPTSTMYWILGTLTFVLIAILINRAWYTRSERDKRHWNRRYFTLDDAGISTAPQCSSIAPEVNAESWLYSNNQNSGNIFEQVGTRIMGAASADMRSEFNTAMERARA